MHSCSSWFTLCICWDGVDLLRPVSSLCFVGYLNGLRQLTTITCQRVTYKNHTAMLHLRSMSQYIFEHLMMHTEYHIWGWCCSCPVCNFLKLHWIYNDLAPKITIIRRCVAYKNNAASLMGAWNWMCCFTLCTHCINEHVSFKNYTASSYIRVICLFVCFGTNDIFGRIRLRQEVFFLYNRIVWFDHVERLNRFLLICISFYVY